MKMYEFMAQNEYDGELILNGYDFSDTCSFCFSKTTPSQTAMAEYPEVLNATFIGMIDGNVIFENKELSNEKTYREGKEFLLAISGYISDKKYQEYFPEPN